MKGGVIGGGVGGLERFVWGGGVFGYLFGCGFTCR